MGRSPVYEVRGGEAAMTVHRRIARKKKMYPENERKKRDSQVGIT